MCFNFNLKTALVTNITLEQLLYKNELLGYVLRKTMRFPYFMFFKCFNINLKTAIVTNITMGTGSFQNELQVCVLRKAMRFLSSMFVFHVF